MNATRPSRGPSTPPPLLLSWAADQANSRTGRVLERVADDRTRHAVTAPRPRPSSAPTIVITSTPALRSELVWVLRSCEHHTGFDGDEVVAAVPLLALVVVLRAAGFHDSIRGAQRRGDHLHERFGLVDHVDADVVVTRHQRERAACCRRFRGRS